MMNFTFWSPTEFLFGKGVEAQTGAMVKKHGGTKALVHYGGGSAIKSGLMAKVEASLKEAGIPYVLLGGAKPNPLSGLVYEGIDLIRKEGIDFVLAVGGGSAIDSAKAMAVGALYQGDFWDFHAKKAEATASLPVGCVLTIAAAGSESSNSCVITNEKTNEKRGSRSQFNRPKFAIMNPEWTYSLPPYHKASGIADMMAHVMERYFTNEKENDLTDRLCEALLCTMVKSGATAMEKPEDYDAHAQLMWASTLAHNDTVGNGRLGDWGPHAMDHELSARFGVTHGAGLAALYPAWMTYVMDHDVMLFAQFAQRVWGVDMDFENPERTAREGIRAYCNFMKRIGLPISLKELDVPWASIPGMAKDVGYHRPGELGNFKPLHYEDVVAVYELAYDFTPA